MHKSYKRWGVMVSLALVVGHFASAGVADAKCKQGGTPHMPKVKWYNEGDTIDGGGYKCGSSGHWHAAKSNSTTNNNNITVPTKK